MNAAAEAAARAASEAAQAKRQRGAAPNGQAQPEAAPDPAPWPAPIASEAFHGLAGRFVALIEPHSESDPAALLIQFLIAAGNVIGRAPYFRVEGDRHTTNLFGLLVGRTASGRKGTSWGRTRGLLERVDEQWARERVSPGLSSGEGLIWECRDPIEKRQPVKDKGKVIGHEMVTVDHGVADKRLLMIESEFASTLRVMAREGNTLSAIVRQAWDDGNLRTLVKNSPARATGAFISIIGHVTASELRRYLDRTELANGFANRFLFCCARRSKLLPEGGTPDERALNTLVTELADATFYARTVCEVTRDDDARRLWANVYAKLSEPRPGLLGAVTSRAEAQVTRLALLYALLDRQKVIGRPHMLAALALWGYCEESARVVFGDTLGDPVADEILRALRASADGLTRTEISQVFARNQDSSQIGRGLAELAELGLARMEREPTAGRPVERWRAVA